MVAGVCAVLMQLGKSLDFVQRFRWYLSFPLNVFLGDHRPRVNDIMMSFLPLAHMLERW